MIINNDDALQCDAAAVGLIGATFYSVKHQHISCYTYGGIEAQSLSLMEIFRFKYPKLSCGSISE